MPARTHLYAHVQQQAHVADERLFVAPQVVQQRAVLHILGDDVDRTVLAADAVKLHQILVLELRHHFCFLDEVVLRHGADFHHLDGRVDGAAPFSATHNAELSRAELLQDHQLRRVDFPFV